jgi:nitroimidazol reductase NimA-like FMN-containing flavoprotein (pyridoxamine 5'-phosphate oxidase superfamily)
MGYVTFTKIEERFLKSKEIGRLATISSNEVPHVVPVSYLFNDNTFLIAMDYDTKKLRNIRRNRSTALVVDTVRPNRGILVQGIARLIERGEEFRRAYSQFYKAFGWVRADPWKEGEAAFIRILPSTKASWGF